MGIFKNLFAAGLKAVADPSPTLPRLQENRPFAATTPDQHVSAPTGEHLPLATGSCNRPGVRPAWMIDGMSINVYEGSDTLEVVGESHRQDNLWTIVGAPRTSQSIRHRTLAVLVPETGNQYDDNAIAVWAMGVQVGYLSRENAQSYRPGLDRLAQASPVALRATIVGGGHGDNLALLGIFLDHDPADFGLEPTGQLGHDGELRTGLSEAFMTDRQDDTYDLRWYYSLPEDTRRAIAKLKSLLAAETDPIDRHFMFAELEWRIYKLRDVEPGALLDYDSVCAQHDSEMERIRPALFSKFGTLPLLETYKQQCVRQQKAKDFQRGHWWAERGLALYGQDAHSQDWTNDLRKRLSTFRAKLDAPVPNPKARPATREVEVASEVEILTCSKCLCSWERLRQRGRKPLLCPTCAAST